ncbi:NAD(P)-dependent oxidoreductase [Methylobacterium sp. J-092]|uniref:NAD(P)-dependent oxidoreductase n=1 Tax=Methylobacterium sp. J-092 TaxID=2836667 RepID=UPI001FBB7A2F|nr:NAD(P)-dependent oxidoreductase [Methylobacterium sp. J-092]MCJ2008299.1 hypothetical protein [Methylobacterium sp. J-092]
MDVAVFSTKPYDRRFLDAAVAGRHALTYIDARLDRTTAVLAGKAQVVCAFVNDAVDTAALNVFAQLGVRLVVLRSAGFNNVDLAAAKRHGIVVARVPAYSPEAVSEHAVALMLSLDRHIHRAYARVRDGNFALDGLLGFNLHGRTVGIVGTGRIGLGVARIMLGFGCKVLGRPGSTRSGSDPMASSPTSARRPRPPGTSWAKRPGHLRIPRTPTRKPRCPRVARPCFPEPVTGPSLLRPIGARCRSRKACRTTGPDIRWPQLGNNHTGLRRLGHAIRSASPSAIP